MERRHIHLAARQVSELKDLATATGIPLAEHVRRAVDDYLSGRRGDPSPPAPRRRGRTAA